MRIQEIEPIREKQRPPCPFYGFGPIENLRIFQDQNGNRCGIIASKHSPCKMEISNKIPYWTNCSFNTEERKKYLHEVLIDFTVFPDEFKPKETESGHGINFLDWMKYIMNQ